MIIDYYVFLIRRILKVPQYQKQVLTYEFWLELQKQFMF